jgi:superfamily II DNA or RNA helicase
MPRIFDNIEQNLLPALGQTLAVAHRADYCVGYFNLRGWRSIDQHIEAWPGGDGHCCRLIVGMQATGNEQLRQAYRLNPEEDGIDQAMALKLKLQAAEGFRQQLTYGAPSNEDEAGLRRLVRQLKDKKVVVKLFVRHSLHAKLYLHFRDDPINPIIGYLGSSNLTFAGLSKQGELNVDVLDGDASQKLSRWFEDRWTDKFCLDISDELIQVIEASWATEVGYTPYEIYLKMVYHLAQEARAGISQFTLTAEFEKVLFPFQKEAVKIAARYLNRENQHGVLLGDVVGLGKTLMATAIAKIFEEDTGVSTLVICPKNLVPMWQNVMKYQYHLRGDVMSSSVVQQELPKIPVSSRFKLLILDESHNFRNRDGKRYRAIREYIEQSESRCILLTATPYNKSYLDLSAQLRLFLPGDFRLPIRPEQVLRETDEVTLAGWQVAPNSLAAFEKSPYADDWRELMRLYLVRRTRSFIKKHYAQEDNGRFYLEYRDGTRAYLPDRQPRTLKFPVQGDQQYAQLYADPVVKIIGALRLPRYGLANYLKGNADSLADARQRPLLANLSRAGKRLIAYCRTNLFKRLESSGQAFVLSLDRHILRNFVFLYALENGLPLPLGTQDAALLDPATNDTDVDNPSMLFGEDGAEYAQEAAADVDAGSSADFALDQYAARAKKIYNTYRKSYVRRFKWLDSALFRPDLKRDLRNDAEALRGVLAASGKWQASQDRKLERLVNLLTQDHPREKILIFTQFADTVEYLDRELKQQGLAATEGVTGQSSDPAALAWRFSPMSNMKRDEVGALEELRVLVATDVLSEGQNLQDAHIVVNYDLPWAIIRLIQRAGRVDRIGQQAETIQCYSFLPADGVDNVIKLRDRVRRRLRENNEVIGADEQFFEDDQSNQDLRDLYTEKSGILDDDPGVDDTDPASLAYAIWQEALTAQPALARKIEAMPEVVYSAKAKNDDGPEGALIYMRTATGIDTLGRISRAGEIVAQSPLAVLRAATCEPDTPSAPRLPEHHDLVKTAVQQLAQEAQSGVGALGRTTGVRYKVYARLKGHYDELQAKTPLFASEDLAKVIDLIYRYQPREAAKDIFNRQLRTGISDADLADLAIALWHDDRLCQIPQGKDESTDPEPLIICSMGLTEK